MIATGAFASAHRRSLGNSLVALVYLGLALWVHRAVLPDPRTLVPLPAALVGTAYERIYQADQRFVLATFASNAGKLLRDPRELGGFGFCYPLRASYVLGEHMFGESLLAVPVYAASGDPVLAYNSVIVLSVWIAALAMYALALHWTGSMPAAFVAGTLFAFNAARLSNPAHPFVHGNLWTPLALLFAERLFSRRGWIDAAGLALFIVLQLLESFYQVLALAILGGVFGLDLLIVHRRTLRELAPKLLAVALVVAVATWQVLGPYLRALHVWGVLQGRPNALLVYWRDYLPGGSSTVGLVALLLAVLGLVDRLRGPRPVDGRDPRLVALVAGMLVMWATLMPFALPLVGWTVPNPLALLAQVVPGLDAVRVLASLRFGVFLVVAFLAAYGVLLVTRHLRGGAPWLVASVLALLALLEAYDRTGTLTPRSAQLTTYQATAAPQVVALVRDLPEGAVLDLPFLSEVKNKLIDMPLQLMLAAYHQRPVAACYNSFPSPLQGEVTRLTDRLPDPAAADGLYALGFRTVLIHVRSFGMPSLAKLSPLLNDGRRIKAEGGAGNVMRFKLSSPVPVAATLATLRVPDEEVAIRAPEAAAALARPSAAVDFRFENRSGATFRHPTFEPLALVARWYDTSGGLVGTAPVRGMLPLVLTPRESATRALEVVVPAGVPAGRYRVDVVSESEPSVVLTRRELDVS